MGPLNLKKRLFGKGKTVEPPDTSVQGEGSEAGTTVASPEITEKYGLFELYTPSQPESCDLDIVAVHGLGGSWDETWEGTNGKMWLKDFIPEQLPNARVLSFGYDAAFALSKSVSDLDDAAISLIDRLTGERQGGAATRSIIFVAHSLGGIVVKRALILANERTQHWQNVKESTIGLMFFAVPHRGADTAYWADVATNALSFTTVGFRGNANLVNALRRNSREFSNISQAFIQLAAEVPKIRTFYETVKMKNQLIVDKDSARLGINNEVAVPIHGADHHTICKFESPGSQKYRPVYNALQLMSADIQISNTIILAHAKLYDQAARSAWNSRISTVHHHDEELRWVLNMPQFCLWDGRNTARMLRIEYNWTWDWEANMANIISRDLRQKNVPLISFIGPDEQSRIPEQDLQGPLLRSLLGQIFTRYPKFINRVDDIQEMKAAQSGQDHYGIGTMGEVLHGTFSWRRSFYSSVAPWQPLWEVLADALSSLGEKTVVVLLGIHGKAYETLIEALGQDADKLYSKRFKMPGQFSQLDWVEYESLHRILVIGRPPNIEFERTPLRICEETEPNQAVAGRKRKAEQQQAQQQGPRKKAPVSAEEKARQKQIAPDEDEIKAKETLANFQNQPRGTSIPRGPIIKRWAQLRKVYVIFQAVGGSTVGGFDVKFVFGRETQTPNLRFSRNEYTLLLRANNFVNEAPRKNQISPGVFRQSSYGLEVTPEVLAKIFGSEHRIHGLTTDQATALLSFGEHKDHSKDPSLSGINCLSFETTNKDKLFFEKKAAKSCDPELEAFVAALNERPHIVVVVRQKGPENDSSLDEFVKRNIQTCVDKGVMHHFNKHMGVEQGKLFAEWQNKPDAVLPHQQWMKFTRNDHGNTKGFSFASHIAKKSVGSLRELEILKSVGVIYDMMVENKIIEAHFAVDVTHKALVIESVVGWVELEVHVSKQDDYAMPAVALGNKFQVRVVEFDQNPEVHEAPKEAPKDDKPLEDTLDDKPDEKSKPQPENPKPLFQQQKTYEWTGRVLGKELEQGDFIIGFFAKGKASRHKFARGSEVKIALSMVRNPIPAMRQLKAIGKICAAPTRSDGIKKVYLQNFLMGAGNPTYETNADGSPKPGVKDDYFSRMTQVEQDRWMAFVNSLGLNKKQQDFFSHVFNSREFVTQLQGPPGTGKTKTLAGTALAFLLLKCKTVMSAPSNTATGQAMRSVLEGLQLLKNWDPSIENEFWIIYLRTTATTRMEMKNLGRDKKAEDKAKEADRRKGLNAQQRADGVRQRQEKREAVHGEQLAHEMFSEGEFSDHDPFKNYTIWSYVVRSMTTKANVISKCKNKEEHYQAIKWMGWYTSMKNGTPMTAEEKKKFLIVGMDERAAIFKDPRVMLVLTTSNNSDQLVDWGYKPYAIIIDESAFATEQDSYVPLSLGGRFHIIGGDHEQLRPIVKSRGENPYDKDLAQSLYERFYGHYSIPLFRLKCNYRMHPDIADLPGMLSYEWLECDPCTEGESDEYLFFKDFWTSPLAARYRKGQRAPLYGNPRSKSIRRLALVPFGSKSAPKPGGTSLRNFANINAIVEFVVDLLKHNPGPGIKDIAGHKITIMTPYKDSKLELEKQLGWAIKVMDSSFQNIPDVTTVDSSQGNESEIIILELTAANQWNGSLIGFMREWNRINVAITRAKSVLIIVGAIDQWREQLRVIVKAFKCKKFALLLIDLLDKGHVIDVDSFDRLPASEEERRTVNPAGWSQKMNDMPRSQSQLTRKQQAFATGYDEKEALKFERELLVQLQRLRSNAELRKQESAAGTESDLPLVHDIDREVRMEEADDDDDSADEGQAGEDEDQANEDEEEVFHESPEEVMGEDAATQMAIENSLETLQQAQGGLQQSMFAGLHDAEMAERSMGDLPIHDDAPGQRKKKNKKKPAQKANADASSSMVTDQAQVPVAERRSFTGFAVRTPAQIEEEKRQRKEKLAETRKEKAAQKAGEREESDLVIDGKPSRA